MSEQEVLDQTVFRIPEPNMEEFRARMQKLERRSAKLGTEPVSFQVLRVEEVPLVTREHPFEWGISAVEAKDGPRPGERVTGYRRYAIVHVTGQRPVLNGWEFVATLQHAGEAGTILRSVPRLDGELDLTAYREAEPWCDHCRLVRLRKDTYVVRYVETGALKQVGSNCLADFLGHASPHEVARYAEYLSAAADLARLAEASDFGGGGGLSIDYLDLNAFLATTAALIRESGWVPRSRASIDRRPTADLALDYFAARRAAGIRNLEIIEADELLADEALTWARELRDDDGELNDYLWNVSVVAGSDLMDVRSAGIAASIVSSFQRNRGDEIQRRFSAENSKHFGTVGEKGEWTLTLTRKNFVDSMYGGSTLMVFVDGEGNVAKWFASNPPEMHEGRTYRIAGAIKSHGKWKGVQETMLTRCRVKDEVS